MNKYEIKKATIEDFRLVIGRFYEEHPDYELLKNNIKDYYIVYEDNKYNSTIIINKGDNNRLNVTLKLLENEPFIKELIKILSQYQFLTYIVFDERQKALINNLLKYVDIIKETNEIKNLYNARIITFKAN